MRFRSLSALSAFAVLAMLLLAVSASGAPGDATAKTYVVQMALDPVVAYEGDVAGYAATKPAKGQKIDPNSAAVKKYAEYLVGQHGAALEKVGGAQRLYDYKYTYNGFAAKLTEGQVVALKKQDGVLAVTEEQEYTVDTSSTPEFLGLAAEDGLWNQLGGPSAAKDGSGAGEDIIIGIVDSGIWPESGSFSDRDENGKLTYLPINTSDWHGRKCQPGEAFAASDCNRKLIGGQHFNASWGGDAAVEAERPWEFMSVRDYNGHGSHTASTSGGNNAVEATGPAAVFGTVSGIAPRARIAAYKALWSTEDASTASGLTGDLVAAIDQAVADGVDVINYSISGSQTSFADPVGISFLFAADAGVFVSASAGNSGPDASTVAHPGPWITTVAAGTHNRDGRGSVTLGNGETYEGASVATAVGPAALIDSVDAGAEGADAEDVELCVPGSLDAAKVDGKIVICKRGVIARVDKSRAVEQAGGVGMVMYNSPDSSLNADFHFVPSVHVDEASGLAIKEYAATADAPEATINQSEIVFDADAPFTADFSSRGPLRAGGGDLLKPDVIAPGQDILAAVAPPGNAGREFNLYSGTSMSAPHVAGLAALMKQLHPTWSPTAIKSALMTTGTDVLDGSNDDPEVIFSQGAGHVAPNSAADPGLVYDSGFNDWLAFLCGTSPGVVNPASCNVLATRLGFSLDPSDLNVASIAIGDMAGVQTVTRRVTNVDDATATYDATVAGLSGITAEVTPSSLTLAPGQTGKFTVTFTRTSATLGEYTGGQLTWTGGGHTVRSPIVINPVAMATPAELVSTGGPLEWEVTTGYDGALSGSVGGLVAPTETTWTVAQDPDQTFNPNDPTGTFAHSADVPANTVFRAGIYEDAIEPTGTDLDLFVYRCDTDGCAFLAQSADGDSNEQVTHFNTAGAATYVVFVHGWSTNGPSATGTLFTWQVGTTDEGNAHVDGIEPAVTAGKQTHSASFDVGELEASTRYLGRVIYSDGSMQVGQTLLSVNTP